MSMRSLSKCPVSSGKDKDYENWRVLVYDWLDTKEKRREIGLELRSSVQGKALTMINWAGKK